MRNFLIVFFITNFCFAQSVDDRIKIRSSYDYLEINKLKKRFENNFLFQQKLIKDFKKKKRNIADFRDKDSVWWNVRAPRGLRSDL